MIEFDVKTLTNLAPKLEHIFPECADAGVELVDQHLLDIERYYPARVTHDESNPYQWTSDRQRRYVMAKLRREGNLPYRRTFDLFNAWHLEGNGRNEVLVNSVPYARFVKSKDGQQAGHKADGWTTIEQDVEKRMTWIGRWFNDGVRLAIERLGLA